MFTPSATQFMADPEKSFVERYPIPREQTKEMTNRIMARGFFILAATMLRPQSIIPSPATMRLTKMNVPVNTGGATAASAPFEVCL